MSEATKVINKIETLFEDKNIHAKVVQNALKKHGGGYKKTKAHLQTKLQKAAATHKNLKKALKTLDKMKSKKKIKRIRSDSERKAMFAAMAASGKSV